MEYKAKERFLCLVELISSACVVASAVLAMTASDSSPFRVAYVALALVYGVVTFIIGQQHYRLWFYICEVEEERRKEKAGEEKVDDASRAVDLMRSVEHYKKTIRDARAAMETAEQELDELLVKLYGDQADAVRERFRSDATE